MKEKQSNKQSSRVCPLCGKSETVIPIVHGYPSPEMMDESQRGEIRLGGCVITGDYKEEKYVDENGKLCTQIIIQNEGPSLYCKSCDREF